jgi:hypothetical protein
MGHIVVVQHIRTKWTKASRGGENARKRNAVPETARVPVQRIVGENLILVHHSLSYPGHRAFQQPREEIRINPTVRPLVIGCVTIDHSAEEAIAAFLYNQGCGGAPDRGWARKTLRLAAGEWGQIVYNGRFAGYDDYWWYEKTVVNVGLFERLMPGVFTHREPICRFAAMGDLF